MTPAQRIMVNVNARICSLRYGSLVNTCEDCGTTYEFDREDIMGVRCPGCFPEDSYTSGQDGRPFAVIAHVIDTESSTDTELVYKEPLRDRIRRAWDNNH